VRQARVWARLLGLGTAVVEGVEFGEEGEVVVAARPRWQECDRCGVCRRRCPGFDLGEGRRRWRALDLGEMRAFVEAESPRVSCAEHGVMVCAVPWARHQARFTRGFEDQVAWLAVHCSKAATAQLMRVADGRPDHRARRGRHRPRGRSAGGPEAHRDRRDLQTQGPALHHRGHRPRQRPAGVGGGLSDEVCVVVVIDQRLVAASVETGAPQGRASWPGRRAAREETHHHEFHAVRAAP